MYILLQSDFIVFLTEGVVRDLTSYEEMQFQSRKKGLILTKIEVLFHLFFNV